MKKALPYLGAGYVAIMLGAMLSSALIDWLLGTSRLSNTLLTVAVIMALTLVAVAFTLFTFGMIRLALELRR